MTLKEAIESGRKFRLPGESWYSVTYDVFSFTKAEILSTDWEVETITKTFSAQDIRNAFEDEKDKYYWHLDYIIKKLGLE